MKNQLLYAVLTVWFGAFNLSNVFAQTSNTNPVIFKAYTTAVKTALINANMKVQRSFSNEPGDTIEQNWSVAGENFLNRFYINKTPVRTLFSTNGKLIYSIMYGKEKDLPKTIAWMIKKEYFDYSVNAATEVRQNKRDIWLVQLQNGYEVITVHIENGAMEEVQQFTKSQ